MSPSARSARPLFGAILACIGACSCALVLASCNQPGSNSITSELLRPVSVSIQGTIYSSDYSGVVSGVEVRIISESSGVQSYVQTIDGETTTDALATSGEDGSFAFESPIELNVDTTLYYLELSHPDGTWHTNDYTPIYAMRDGVLDYDNLLLVPLAPQSYTVVSASIKDLLSGSPVSGLIVRIEGAAEAELWSGTSGDDGSVSIPNVPVGIWTLSLDGSNLDPAYIVETREIVLENSANNALGDLRVSPASDSDDLRIVLSWTNRDLDLNGYLSIPNQEFDFNHLGTKRVELPSSAFTVNPAFNFASGTSYWPDDMGGDDSMRVLVGPENAYTTWPESGDTVADLDNYSDDGSIPEIITLYRRSPMQSMPSNLAYYYSASVDGIITNRYPVGMGVYQVICRTEGGSIYDSGATVKVYQGDRFIGQFTAADLEIDANESNRRYWPVLQVETGFASPNPATDSELYFRVVPWGSSGTPPSIRFPGFFLQETRLPGNENFTTFLDRNIYGLDYYFVPPPLLQQVFLSREGGIYNRPGTYTSGPFTSFHLAGNPELTHAVYWMNPTILSDGPVQAKDLYIMKAVSNTNTALILQVPATDDNADLNAETDLTIQAPTGTTRINDSCIVRFRDQNYGEQSILLLATSNGPRAASTINLMGYSERLPSLDTWYAGATDLSDGTVLSTGSSRILHHALAARERDGTLGNFALVGGQGLFRFCAANAVFDTTPGNASGWTSGDGNRAIFRSVINTGGAINLSDSSISVRAIAEFPTLGPMHFFFVSVFDENTQRPRLFRVDTDESGNPGSPTVNIYEINDQGILFNTLAFVKAGYVWVLMGGSDNGLYIATNPMPGGNSIEFTPWLQPMLGGFSVSDIIDYNGTMGLFVKDNGLIYGPWPQGEGVF